MLATVFVSAVYYAAIFDWFASGQTNYCNICSGHTLCLYPFAPGPACLNYNRSELLTSDDRLAILNRHNDYRARIAEGLETRGNPGPQPPASDMRMLEWDTELETIAQRWADQCVYGHDACRNVARFRYVGQNSYQACSFQGRPNIEFAVDGWFNEVSSFSNQNIERYAFNPLTGEYSQMIWANTSRVGCGQASYFNPLILGNCLTIHCNYGPGGNIVGLPVYRPGPAASACSSGVSSSRPSLCN